MHDSVGNTGKGLHESCQAASGEDLDLKIVVVLMLAASTKLRARAAVSLASLSYSRLSSSSNVVISRVSGTTENLDKLAYKCTEPTGYPRLDPWC